MMASSAHNETLRSMEDEVSEIIGHNVNELPLYLIELLAEYFSVFHNDTIDFTRPHLRRSVGYIWPLFVVLYSLVVVVGVAGNAVLVATVLRHRLHRDPTYFLLLNVAVSDLIKCLLVVPVTLINLLLQNWIFGRTLCYVIPMMHSVPMYVTCLTFLLVALDRYRLLVGMNVTSSSRLPRVPCVVLVWVVSVCAVLPFLMFISYFDLRPNIAAGLCYVNVHDTMQEYARCLFIILYVLPLATIAYLQVRISGEIKNRERGPLSATVVVVGRRRGHLDNVDLSGDGDSTATVATSPGSGTDTPCPTRNAWRSSGGDTPSTALTTVPSTPRSSIHGRKPSNHHPLNHPATTATINNKDGVDLKDGGSDRFQTVELQWRPLAVVSIDPAVDTEATADEEQMDARHERRTQSYLMAMVTAFALCQLPVEIMRMVRIVIFEYNENAGVFDLLYLVFVLISYLSVCITPVLFVCWKRGEGGKLSGYLQFGGGITPAAGGQLDPALVRQQSAAHNGVRHNQRNLKLHIQQPNVF